MKKTILTLIAILFSASVFAKDYSYECSSYYWNGFDGENATMILKVSGDTAYANIMEVSWDDNLGGQLDAQYISYGVVKFVKFGADLYLDGSLLNGGRKLKDGSMGGIAKVEGLWKGHMYQYKFVCSR